MIRKLLIANRGEIAARIIRTCERMSIESVAVYSDADSGLAFVEAADEAVHLGGSAASESYLNIQKIIDAARATHADAIHPGYGFLAENATFAQAVMDAGLIWIGPTPNAIQAMGKKRESKLLLKDLPLVPGYQAEDQADETLIRAAQEVGFPLMVKASAGGGGKGMRRVDHPDALPEALALARREAKQAFGDDTLILEKYVETPRHIEIQIFGDKHGNVIAIGERECSIQRRHQKIIEETPSPAVDDALRESMSAVAVSIGKQLGYVSAGTVEFLLDPGGNFYFMEMNTRLQVEHPVTEAVYGVDLVEWQIRIAEGELLPQIDLAPHGHAIEVRVYAEDPSRDFLPATGQVLLWQPYQSEAIRIDAGIRTGDTVTINYDPMIAKIIAHGATREEAIRHLAYALSKTALFGLRHNIHFLHQTLIHPDFIAGNLNTAFIDQHPELFSEESALPESVIIATALTKMRRDGLGTAWRNNRNSPIRETFNARGETFTVGILPEQDGTFCVTLNGEDHRVRFDNTRLTINGKQSAVTVAHHGGDYWVLFNGSTYQLTWKDPLPVPGRAADAEGSLRAPMPGQVIAVFVEVGQHIDAGQTLMALEAMKMEHRIQAPHEGVVKALYYAVGEAVQADAVLLEIEPVSAPTA